MDTTNILNEAAIGKRPRPTKRVVISFLDEDMEHGTSPRGDALVNIAEMNDFYLIILLSNFESSTNVLYLDAFLTMRMINKE